MAQLTALEISNWIAIYVATGLCCAIAVTLSISLLLHDLFRERVWTGLTTVRGTLLFLPRIWWRWQKLYLLSTPVTLGIVGAFATTLRW